MRDKPNGGVLLSLGLVWENIRGGGGIEKGARGNYNYPLDYVFLGDIGPFLGKKGRVGKRYVDSQISSGVLTLIKAPPVPLGGKKKKRALQRERVITTEVKGDL